MTAVFDAAQFEEKLASWLVGAQQKVDAEYGDTYPLVVKLELMRGQKYIRVVRMERSRTTNELINQSAHAFVDTTNGDVLKTASWKMPAKHARGNIFDASNGLSCMGPYGAAYLR